MSCKFLQICPGSSPENSYEICDICGYLCRYAIPILPHNHDYDRPLAGILEILSYHVFPNTNKVRFRIVTFYLQKARKLSSRHSFVEIYTGLSKHAMIIVSFLFSDDKPHLKSSWSVRIYKSWRMYVQNQNEHNLYQST